MQSVIRIFTLAHRAIPNTAYLAGPQPTLHCNQSNHSLILQSPRHNQSIHCACLAICFTPNPFTALALQDSSFILQSSHCPSAHHACFARSHLSCNPIAHPPTMLILQDLTVSRFAIPPFVCAQSSHCTHLAILPPHLFCKIWLPPILQSPPSLVHNPPTVPTAYPPTALVLQDLTASHLATPPSFASCPILSLHLSCKHPTSRLAFPCRPIMLVLQHPTASRLAISPSSFTSFQTPHCAHLARLPPLVSHPLTVTISFLSHVFFLISVVRRPYFSFAPSYQETDRYLLAFPSYSSLLVLPL